MEPVTKQTALIGATLLGLIVLGIIVWYMATHPATPAPIAPVAPGATTTPTTYGSDTIKDEGQYYTAEASYPTNTPLAASAGTQADAAVVALMRTFGAQEIERFKDGNGISTLTPEDIQMFGLNDGRRYELDVEFELKESSKTISYVYTIYADTLGAHPNLYYRTFTFDRATGEAIDIYHLFREGSGFLERLSQISRRELPRTIEALTGVAPDTEYIENGTHPIADSFSNFYLEKDVLVLVFPPYQVGPYALGTQEVRVPLSEVAGILANEYRP